MPQLSEYGLTEDEVARLNRDFTYHAPFGNQPERYGRIRDAGGDLACLMMKHAPRSRELSLALTKIEEAVFWANAAIARNEKPV